MSFPAVIIAESSNESRKHPLYLSDSGVEAMIGGPINESFVESTEEPMLNFACRSKREVEVSNQLGIPMVSILSTTTFRDVGTDRLGGVIKLNAELSPIVKWEC